MKPKAVAAVLLLFALFVVGAPCAKAQTTYVLKNQFACDAASRFPITSWSEFTCRGAFFYDVNNNSAEMYVWASLPRLYVNTASFLTTNATFQLTNFTTPLPANCGYQGDTNPPCTTPGTFAFTWQGTDANGNPHNGTVSGTWINYQTCGGRGCQWFIPLLQPGSTLTINQ